MKKSKIIVPAIAALCIGAAASVSGTLAWFSASNSASVSANNICVINAQGNLNAGVTAGKNTKKNGAAISLDDGVKLRDASANIYQKSGETKYSLDVYEATDPTSTGSATTYKKVDDSFIYNTTTKVCYAATWEITFSIDGADPKTFDIYWDAANTATSIKTGDDQDIYNSFRIAIYSKDDASAFMVFNDLNSNDTFDHVKSTSETDTYTNQDTDYKLGTIGTKSGSGSSTATSLTVYCVCWFDGCDPSCVSSAFASGKESNASSSIAFYASEAA